MPPTPSNHVSWSAALTPAEAEAVRELARAADAVDRSPPLNDAARFHLDDPSDPVRHALVTDAASTVIAYAQLDAAGVAQLVVHPDHRRQGHGRDLVAALQDDGPRTLAWAFGDLPGARALAGSVGATPVRTLLQMHRDLGSGDPPADPPVGVTFRSFRPGVDEAAWVALNALAFADHPEQGRLGVDDVVARERSDWFDPEGFILAERAGRLIGFHWTKSHDDRTGEVYVLGVHPDEAGVGLGRVLLDRGLAHLRRTGHTEVILYVEGDHDRVVRMYRASGFTETTRDVIYAVTDREPGAGWS